MSDLPRTYTLDEDRHLALNLQLVTAEVYSGAYHARRADESLLCQMHAAIFEGVRDHAGLHRSRTFGTEYLIFGPNRSVHRSQVEDELRSLLSKLARTIASFDDNPDDPAYERLALRAAVWTHAELIRIHPFEDGNGRTSRLFMNWTLVRLGLRPIAFEIPKQEYHACLNHYFTCADIQVLIDLALRLCSFE